MRKLIVALLAILAVVAACRDDQTDLTPTNEKPSQPATSTVSPAIDGADEEPIYLAIIWHQHQPVYYKDPDTNTYVRPWVRVHATKDYVDMATTVEQYPELHMTFNLTPSLIRQLDDLQAGARDLYWVYSEIPAADLTDDQRRFLLDRFFDTNREIIGRFPRYQELLLKRDMASDPLTEYGEQDFRDLQILFNLAWTDPDWLAMEPLLALVDKGRDFVESDKATLFDEHVRLIGEVIPVHRRLQDAGQLEITMTPFAHPILPLLVTTDLAKVAMPKAELPGERFVNGNDALDQVSYGVELYRDHFGRDPVGMWPAEGAVAQEIVSMVALNGIKWMATDEGVLANSLGLDNFTRDSKEVVLESDVLYRPYYVQGGAGEPVAMVFRDVVLSDKVGFTYSGTSGSAAAADFINRIHAIRDRLQSEGYEGPHLVSVILDGENAWEYYENDGKDFLHALYQGLSNDPLIKTVTPSEFLEIAPEQPMIDELWAGSWISHDFSTWIGEDEENRAWNYLTRAREMLRKYENGVRKASPEAIEKARVQMFIAEGSDWFWWYGADQDSGNDESFDQQYRDTLRSVYTALDETPPTFLDIPIIPQNAVQADRPSTNLFAPTIDGITDPVEWQEGGQYLAAEYTRGVRSFTYGFDRENFYIRFEAFKDWTEIAADTGTALAQLYLGAPGGRADSNFSMGETLLGFPGNYLVRAAISAEGLVEAKVVVAEGESTWLDEGIFIEAAVDGKVLELAVPLPELGSADVGDHFSVRVLVSTLEEGVAVDLDLFPPSGPSLISVPDLGMTTIVLDIADPISDDFGPGTYEYPHDVVFGSGSFDITGFQIGFDDENVVFKFQMRGPVDNVWGSGNGLSIQTFDVYIDIDQNGLGGKAMLPGRNLAFAEPFAWDYAITIEGWESGVFEPTEDGDVTRIAEPSEFFVLADGGQQKVTIKVPKEIIGDALDAWRVAAVVLGQEGYPAAGVMRVRDVNPVAEQWRFGGAPEGATNHTRVIDFVWPDAGQQELLLAGDSISSAAQGDLTADDFAVVPMMSVVE